MKVIVKKGTEIFDKLTEIRDRIDECKEAAQTLATDNGFEGHGAYDTNLGTGLDGFVCKKGVPLPEGFRKLDWQHVFPKKIKANKELLDKIAALPVVKNSELLDIIGYEPESIGLRLSRRPGVIWGEEYHLLSFIDGTKFKPTKGMREITASKYHELKAQLEQALNLNTSPTETD